MFNEKELEARYRARRREVNAMPEDPGWDAKAFMRGPQAELLARLNAFVRWIDPGEPVNWRGL